MGIYSGIVYFVKAAHPAIWDRVGALAGTVCAVHCALTGVALALLSTVGLGFLSSPWFDWLFVAIAVSVGSFAVYHGIRKHKSFAPSLLFVAGLTFVIVARLLHTHHDAEVGHAEAHSAWLSALSVLGGLCLVAFHWLNSHLQHRHDAECSCGKRVCSHDA